MNMNNMNKYEWILYNANNPFIIKILSILLKHPLKKGELSQKVLNIKAAAIYASTSALFLCISKRKV